MLSVYAQSTQYIEVPITNEEGINPTGDTVQFAFLGPYANVSQATEAVPSANTTYYLGQWQSTTPVLNTAATYNATCLIGPGSGAVVQLTTGTYLVIVKVGDDPEVPILFSGPMVVN